METDKDQLRDYLIQLFQTDSEYENLRLREQLFKNSRKPAVAEIKCVPKGQNQQVVMTKIRDITSFCSGATFVVNELNL